MGNRNKALQRKTKHITLIQTFDCYRDFVFSEDGRHFRSSLSSHPEVTSEPMEQDDEEKDLVPSRSQTPTLNPSDFYPGLTQLKQPLSGSHNKPYKQTILQRYLGSVDVMAFNSTRSRKPSGSIGSRDYEEMSTSSGVSMNDSHHLPVFDGKWTFVVNITIGVGIFKRFPSVPRNRSSYISTYR